MSENPNFPTETLYLEIEPDMMMEEIDDLKDILRSVRDLFDSYLYAAPEMQGYWRDQILDRIAEVVGRD